MSTTEPTWFMPRAHTYYVPCECGGWDHMLHVDHIPAESGLDEHSVPTEQGHKAVLRSNHTRACPDRAPAPQPAADTALRDRLTEVLGDDVYVVGRVWEAWSHGTMTADDFTLATEIDVLDDLLAAAAPPAADTETEVQWGVRLGTGRVIEQTSEPRARAFSEDMAVVAPDTAPVVVKRHVTPWEEA